MAAKKGSAKKSAKKSVKQTGTAATEPEKTVHSVTTSREGGDGHRTTDHRLPE